MSPASKSWQKTNQLMLLISSKGHTLMSLLTPCTQVNPVVFKKENSFQDAFVSDLECNKMLHCSALHLLHCSFSFLINQLEAQVTKTSKFIKTNNKLALCRYRIRPAFLPQLMLSCENECTLSALCTKAHTRKFPVFSVSKAMWHSEGHLAVLFYIFFHHKNVVFLCFMRCFGDLF